MPSQLLARLNRFLDQQPANDVMALEFTPRNNVLGPAPPPPNPTNKPAANIVPHWPHATRGPDFGIPIPNPQSVVIHETCGWPSYASADNFRDLFRCLNELDFQSGLWIHKRGIGPQFFVDPNGSTFALIGPPNLAGDPRLTWHAELMNAFALGIENGYTGDGGVIPGNGLGPRIWRMSNQPEDLIGLKAYVVLHPDNAQDATLIWIAQFPHFIGSGDVIAAPGGVGLSAAHYPNWKNMLFTERDYHSLALLCRLLAEQCGMPRNFPLLPYLQLSVDAHTADAFRKLILTDQRCDLIAHKLGTTTAFVHAGGPPFSQWYNAQSWNRFFGVLNSGVADTPCFKGFLSHDINGNHHCPGPLFDWHRFAREIWDWWWYPFDFEPPLPTTSVTRRPYLRARRDTPLLEYFYDTLGAATDYDQLHPPLTADTAETFQLSEQTPIYAMANGVIVAARFVVSSGVASRSFLLVRHEVFHQGDPLSQHPNRVDYDLPPTVVWSLISSLVSTEFRLGQLADANPDWLNRFLMRLTECELALSFHGAATGANPAGDVSALLGTPVGAPSANSLNTALSQGWAHVPSSAGPRHATGDEIELDAATYRRIANDLGLGRAALFPLESGMATPTPVRVILGDFLGYPDVLQGNQHGIQVEIFSKDKLDVPGAAYVACSANAEDWWGTATGADRHEGTLGEDLPSNGFLVQAMAWHYPVTEFLKWINDVTWTSEWDKYDMPVVFTRPPRPITRLVI